MKPTEEQIKEIEERALELYPPLILTSAKGNSDDTFNPPHEWDDNEDKRKTYIAGATAQLEKFPCSPEEAREAIDLLKRQNDANDYDGPGPVIEIRTFLNKLK